MAGRRQPVGPSAPPPDEPSSAVSPPHLLVLGGAGTGKSVRLASRAAELVDAGRGGEVLVLVPSRQAVRLFTELVVERSGRRALVGPRVLTFGALVREVRRGAAEPARPALSPAERRDFVAALILAALRGGRLAALAASASLPGFASTFERLAAELRSSGTTAAGLRRALAAAALRIESAPERGLFEAKGADLVRLYAGYENLLASSGASDEEGAMREAARLLESGRAGPPAGARVVLVDGFAQFTPAQERLLAAVLGRAAESMVALCFDGRADGRMAHVHAAWRAVKASRTDWAEERLSATHRFRSPDLAALEGKLFTGGRAEGVRPEHVEVAAAGDVRSESEAVARRAARLVRDEGYRPEEIAVFARRLAPYAPHLERAFRLARLPLDFAEGLPARELAAPAELGLALHAALPVAAGELVRWLRSAADLDGAAAFIEALRGPLATEAERRGAAELAAVAEELGLSSVAALEGRRESLGGEARALLSAGIARRDAIGRLLPSGDAAPRAWADGAARCMAGIELDARLLATGWELSVLRRELAALDVLRSALAGAARAAERAGLEQLGLGEYLRLVESAIAGRSLPAPGQRAGAVLAANIFESRTRERRAVFVMGLAEGAFPRDPRENPLLGDRERRLLRDEGLELPLAAAAIEQERYLFYIACTRARERLFLFSAAPGSTERAAAGSFFLDEVEAVFGSAGLERVELGGSSPDLANPAWKAEALAGLSFALNSPRPDGDAARARWRRALALHAGLLDSGVLTARELVRLAPRKSAPGALADPRALEALAGLFAVQTASGLAAFGNCPFAHFLLRGLGLSARRRLRLDARLAGDLLHAALRRAYAQAQGGGRLPAPEEAGRLLGEELAANFPSLVGQPQTEPFLAAQEPLLRRMLAEDAERFASCGTRPAHLELVFGGGRMRRGDDPASRRETLPLGGGLALRGRIDRVDLLPGGRGAVVIDYKRSMRSSWKSDPQTLLYALALREVFGLEPAGAGLLGLRGADGRRSGGMLLPAAREALAAYGFKGELGPELLDEARRAAAELAARAAAGDVRVWPVECASCPDKDAYNPICRFDGPEWRAELGWVPEGEAEMSTG